MSDNTSEIPQQVKDKIKEAARIFCKKEPVDKSIPMVKLTSSEYSLAGLLAYNAGAEFGYQLAQQEIAELKKEVEAGKQIIELQNKQLEESLRLYECQNAAIIKRDSDLADARTLIKKAFETAYYSNSELGQYADAWKQFCEQNNLPL